MFNNSTEIVGVILSGGLSRRMGNRDKSLLPLASKPLFEHVLDRFSPQCSSVIISSNSHNEQLSSYQLPIIKDSLEGFLGPLAGLLASMEWVQKHQPTTQWIATVPVDTPFLPTNLVSSLYQSIQDNHSTIACAVSNKRTHPVIGLWPVKLLSDLRVALTEQDIRKIDLWTSHYKVSHPDFSYKTIDPFFNINCNEDLTQAEVLFNELGKEA